MADLAPVVDADWYAAHRDEVVLADVRWYLDGRSGRAAYLAGHLPGAVFVDLERTLAGPGSPAAGRHPLPSPAAFAEGMAAAGIGDATPVVAYDDAGGVVAARLVWLLRALDHPAALLDGGLLDADLVAGLGPLETAPAHPGAARFAPRPWPAGRLATLEEATSGAGLLVDARDRSRYRGDEEPLDPRPGHIPGAVSLPCREHLDSSGRLLPVAELRARIAAAGVTAADRVVAYCGSGVTACHDLLVLEHAGLGTGRLFPGSWSQYAHSERPAALGDTA